MKPGTVSSWLSRLSQTFSKSCSEPFRTRKRFIAMNMRGCSWLATRLGKPEPQRDGEALRAAIGRRRERGASHNGGRLAIERRIAGTARQPNRYHAAAGVERKCDPGDAGGGPSRFRIAQVAPDDGL